MNEENNDLNRATLTDLCELLRKRFAWIPSTEISRVANELLTKKVVTSENIDLIKAMTAQSSSEIGLTIARSEALIEFQRIFG